MTRERRCPANVFFSATEILGAAMCWMEKVGNQPPISRTHLRVGSCLLCQPWYNAGGNAIHRDIYNTQKVLMVCLGSLQGTHKSTLQNREFNSVYHFLGTQR